jgi:GTP-binding protein
MKITSSEFVISAVRPEQYPSDGMPEIALAGRSNVGKSSLINRLINRKNLARTSAQPGKTQQLNYYRINNALYFVDFPGYGYAKVSKSERAAWGRMIETYLAERRQLALVMQIVDSRHEPSADDVLMFNWLAHYQIPVCIVATKVDKISRNSWDKQKKVIRQKLGAPGHVPFILTSAETGLGRDEVWEQINRAAADLREELGLAPDIGAEKTEAD